MTPRIRSDLPLPRREPMLAGAAAFAGAIAVAALGIYASADPSPAGRADRPRPGATVDIQVLGVNDLHGHLESPATAVGPGGARVALGGAAVLAAQLERAAARYRGRTIRVTAGDMVGASPMLSSWFSDEPTARALNLMRFDLGTVGNHDFDEGVAEMMRLRAGGSRRGAAAFRTARDRRRVRTSARDFEGIRFPLISASVADRARRLALPPVAIARRAGVRIGFIGVTTTSAPDYLLPPVRRRLRFGDLADSVNRWVPYLRRRGVEAIVVLAHAGARRGRGGKATGEIVTEAREMDPAVDLVVSGHTHSRLDLRVPNRSGRGDKLVVQARAYGTAFDRVILTVDRASGEVVAKRAAIVAVRAGEVRPDARVAALVRRYRAALGSTASTVLGRARRALRPATFGGPADLGAVAAEAQRRLARADIALVNDGDMRGTIAAGPITLADVFEVQAYESQIMRFTMTGAQLRRLLDSRPGARLHSAGPVGSLDPGRTYTVAANELLATSAGLRALSSAARRATAVGTDFQALAAEVRRRRRIG